MKIKNIVFFVSLATPILFAQSGEELFSQNCAKCHSEVLGIVNDGGYENSYITRAPYVAKLVAKLKDETGSKEKFAEFIKGYIQNPDKRKSLYGKRAIKKFGLMPSLKGVMNDEEIAKLTNFLYTFNDEKSVEQKKPIQAPKEITNEEKLFNTYCAKCHLEILGTTNDGGYENSYITQAPYIGKLIPKLKDETGSKKKFSAFIREYIQNPNKRKSLYGKRAIKKFGLMPSLKGVMNDEEITGLANFLYEKYSK